MRLAAWLKRNHVGRAEFAGRISLSKDTISQICNQDAGCVSRETAQLIFRETARAVSPNDFLSRGNLGDCRDVPFGHGGD
jgi:3,4-dihydroxy 2-butanone 4-phosphate synthase / GTP cyclohydrolase II